MSKSTQITAPDLKRPNSITFRAGRQAGIEMLLKRLDHQFIVEETANRAAKRIYHDTFDWRLYRRNLVFYRCGNRLVLRTISGGQVASAVGRNRNRYFWWDVPDGELQTRLQDCIEMRALCPIVSVVSTVNAFRVMNDDRKTVVRVSLQRDSLDGRSEKKPRETIVIEEIRGYEVPYRRVVQQCLDLRLRKIGRRSETKRILKQSGRVPGGYGDKFDVAFDPAISVGAAVSKICLRLAADMEANRDGIVADIDSEFLHDFRIAVRRTRSLISLLKNNLPPEMTGHFRGEFKWLGSVTGPVRDIDVYLLEKNDYLNLLPESLRPGLQLFFDELLEQRVDELKQLQTHLTSTRYEALIKNWRRFLSDRDGELFAGDMRGACRACADGMIISRFRSFIKKGNAITDASPDESLHRLRIAGKKFRYLLEFFRSFYDETKMGLILKQMKTLQNNLGDFNDLSVQQEVLNRKLDSLRGRTLQTIRLASALGGLIAVLDEKQTEVRDRFASTYGDFSNAHVEAMLLGMIQTDSLTDGKKR